MPRFQQPQQAVDEKAWDAIGAKPVDEKAWEAIGAKPVNDSPYVNQAIKDAQKAKYPTAYEQGQAKTPGEITPAKSVLSPEWSTMIPRALAGAGRIARIPYDMAVAATKPADTPEEAVSQTVGGVPGLLAERLVGAPARNQWQKSKDAKSTSERWGYRIGAAVPMLGPWATGMGERAGSGDIVGAGAELAAGWAAPHLAGSAGKGTIADVARSTMEDIHSGKGFRRSLQDRTMTSLVQPDKKAFDFGADPVEAAKNLPPSLSTPGMRRRGQGVITSEQANIQQHVADRVAAASEVGAETGIDVGPHLQAAADRAIADAVNNGNTALARQIQKSHKALIEKFNKQYGGTYLEPNEIIYEKTDLGNNTKFIQDTVGQNLNTARMEMYKGMDGALNSGFGSREAIGTPTTGNAVEPIDSPVKTSNRNIASHLELDRLLERKELADAKAPMTGRGSGIIATVRAVTPEVFPKTALNRFLGGGKGAPTTKGASSYSFFNRPKPGPYESGYQNVEGPPDLYPRTGPDLPDDGLSRDPYTGKVTGYANRNLPVRVEGRQMPAYSGGDPHLESKAGVTTGPPLARDIGGGINTHVPAKLGSVASQGPAKGMVLSHIEPPWMTGASPTYIYTELGSGKQLRFTVPQ